MDALPAQAEVYERLARGLHVALVDLGTHRVSGTSYPCWVMKSSTAGEQIFLAMQVDRKATDTYAGGGFRLELEKSNAARPAAGLNGRAMFFQLLRAQELAAVLAQQNRVIRALPKPPPAQIEAYPAGPVRQVYLSSFKAQDGFDPIRSWLRYRNVSDIDAWTRTLQPLLAAMFDRADEYLKRGKLHLGRGSLVEVR